MDQGAGDGEAQPDTAGLGVARFIESHERLEHILEPRRIDPRPVIADPDQQLLLAPLQRHFGAAGIFDGVADQVLQHPAQGVGPTGVDLFALRQTGDRLAGIGIVIAQADQQADQIQFAGSLLLSLLAGKAEGRRQHLLHLLQGLLDAILVLAICQKLAAQAQAGDGGAQIVGDGGQHPGSVLHEAIKPGMHPVEGLNRFADLGRPLLFQGLDILAPS